MGKKYVINIIIAPFFLLIFSSCNEEICPVVQETEPLFGKQKKCIAQKRSDRLLVEREVAKEKGDFKLASIKKAQKGWFYLGEKNVDSAIIFFNHAWLIDSTNSRAYLGFGTILGQKKRFKEALPFFEKALTLDSGDAKIWLRAASSYGRIYIKERNKKDLKKNIKYLKKTLQLNSQEKMAYRQLVMGFLFSRQYDSAWVYTKKADKLDTAIISPKIRTILYENL